MIYLKYKWISIILIIIVCTSCTDIKLKKHLKRIGFNCNGNICEDSYEFTDYDNNNYFAYGYNYTFDLKNKAFHMGYYEFGQQNGKISSSTGSNSYTYYWEKDTATAKNVVSDGTFEYNCNTEEISFKPMFSWNTNDNCKWLDEQGEYYQVFVNQCNNLEQYCKKCYMKYYEYIYQ